MLKINDIKEAEPIFPLESLNNGALVEIINQCIEVLNERHIPIFDADDDEWRVDKIEYDEAYDRFLCGFKDA